MPLHLQLLWCIVWMLNIYAMYQLYEYGLRISATNTNTGGRNLLFGLALGLNAVSWFIARNETLTRIMLFTCIVLTLVGLSMFERGLKPSSKPREQLLRNAGALAVAIGASTGLTLMLQDIMEGVLKDWPMPILFN